MDTPDKLHLLCIMRAGLYRVLGPDIPHACPPRLRHSASFSTMTRIPLPSYTNTLRDALIQGQGVRVNLELGPKAGK